MCVAACQSMKLGLQFAHAAVRCMIYIEHKREALLYFIFCNKKKTPTKNKKSSADTNLFFATFKKRKQAAKQKY